MKDRLGRVDELIKREVSVIILDEIEDPLVRSVTITEVDVSKDLGLARISYVVCGTPGEKESVAKALRRAAGFIRGRLAKKVSLKVMPRISFREDKSEERQKKINELFDILNRERTEGGGRDEVKGTEGAQE